MRGRIVAIYSMAVSAGFALVTCLPNSDPAKVLIERWCQEYNMFRPQSVLGRRPPASEAMQWSIQTAIGLQPAAAVGPT